MIFIESLDNLFQMVKEQILNLAEKYQNLSPIPGIIHSCNKQEPRTKNVQIDSKATDMWTSVSEWVSDINIIKEKLSF